MRLHSICIIMAAVLGGAGWTIAAAPISADHPGFSDASAVVSPGTFQAETGFETAFGDVTSAAAALLARVGIVDSLEVRAEIPALVVPVQEGQNTQLDVVEAGIKWQCLQYDTFSLALLPSVLIPTGSRNGVIGGVSGSLSVIADIPLASDWTLTTSVTPRWIRLNTATKLDSQWDLSFAAGAGWSATDLLGLYVEMWGVVAKGADGYEVNPAGDVVVTYLLTPNMMLDAYVGVQWAADTATPYVGVGYSFRL